MEGLEEGRAEGREEGRAEGREEGRIEEARRIAKSLKLNGTDVKLIAEITKLAVSEIERL